MQMSSFGGVRKEAVHERRGQFAGASMALGRDRCCERRDDGQQRLSVIFLPLYPCQSSGRCCAPFRPEPLQRLWRQPTEGVVRTQSPAGNAASLQLAVFIRGRTITQRKVVRSPL
jgi:hypothetical protein